MRRQLANRTALRFALAALLFALPAAALSHPGNYDAPRRTRFGVPEFDPAAAGLIGVLVASGGLLLARRRSQKR